MNQGARQFDPTALPARQHADPVSHARRQAHGFDLGRDPRRRDASRQPVQSGVVEQVLFNGEIEV